MKSFAMSQGKISLSKYPPSKFHESFSKFAVLDWNKKSVNTKYQINFLFVVNLVLQCYHFSKQFLSNLSKIKYLAFFKKFCFVVSLAKMVTLTTNIVYKKSAQYRKYIGLPCKMPFS